MKEEPESLPVPLIILVWGFSIHAKRRIAVFSQDPRFRVAVISNYPYEIPGADLHLLPSATCCESLDRETLKSRILRLMEGPDKELILRACRFLLTQGSAIITEFIDSIRDAREIKRIIAKFDPELLILQTLLYPTYLVFFIRIKAPILITFWNGDVIWWAKYTFFERLFKKQIVRRGVVKAKAITVNSSSAFDACRSIGKDAADIHLIRYPGVDLTIFNPGERSKAREKLHLTADHIILWPRGAGHYHNVQTLLRAVPGLVHRYPAILFIMLQVIQSDNVLNQEIADWTRLNPQYRKNFLCLGSIPHHIMPDYYRASDMMVSLSSHDSLPNSMLEAMACKIPLIMGDIPQIREWIVDGVNGFLVPVDSESAFSERVVRICEGKMEANERLVQGNLALIEREFDSRVITGRIKDLVAKIAEENRAG